MVGLLVGKIKIHTICLDVSAVLITAIIVGFILSSFSPSIFDDDFGGFFAQFSKLGTSLFMTVIGLSSGQNITKDNLKKDWIYIILGSLIVFMGFVSTKLISLVDANIEESLLLGIFCGAMTSTPALASISEITNINSVLATVGYGMAYICGVIGVVLYVQLRTCKKDKNHNQLKITNNERAEDLLYISSVAIIGFLVGCFEFPLLNYSLGTTGGTLITGIIVGAVFKNKFSKCLNAFRNLGLVMFFVGNGILAGRQLNCTIDIKYFFYGMIITLFAVASGDFFTKIFIKTTLINKMCIVAGGMTSTPAIGLLAKTGNSQVDMSAYSFAYLGALLTITIGTKIFLV